MFGPQYASEGIAYLRAIIVSGVSRHASAPGRQSRDTVDGNSVPAPTIRTDLCDIEAVKGSEFLRKLQRLARRRSVRFQYDPGLGKGSHGRVWLEAASTILKDPEKELGTGLLRDMCRDLGIGPRDL